MLARLRERRQRKRQEIETRLAIVDAAYGRLDGEDAPGFTINEMGPAGYLGPDDLAMDDSIAAAEGEPIDDQKIIHFLEGQLEIVLQMLKDANEIADAAREFAKTITAINTATGESVYRTTRDDELATQLLNHRYSDLAALLNGSGRPVPGKLAQGTIH